MTGGIVAAGAEFGQSCDLRVAHRDIINLKDINRGLGVRAILVHPHNHLITAINRRLSFGSGLLDPQFRHARGNSLCHTAHRLDFLDQHPGIGGQLCGQAFHIIAARQRVDHLGNSGFFLQDQLGIAGDPGGKFRWQGHRLVQRVGVQALGAAQGRRQRLIGGAHDVVIGIGLLQTDAGGLAMRAQHQGVRVGSTKFRHDPVPQKPGGAEFGGLHEKVHADGKEERQTGGEIIDLHTARQGGFHIFAAIGKGEAQFLHKVRAGLLHMVAGDRDRVELRHFGGRVFDDIRHNPHRGFGRINIGVAHHEFFQNVILNGPRKRRARHTLFFACDDKTGEDRNHRTIHRHGNADFFQRNAVEQDLHILD